MYLPSFPFFLPYTTSPSYSVQISGTLAPVGDAIYSLGSSTNRFNTLYAQSTTVGAFFEVGLRTEGVGINPTGTIVIWKNGKLEPSMLSNPKDKDYIHVIMPLKS